MVFEEVDPANNSIGSFTAVTRFISKEVDLPWKCFAVDSKHRTLSWCQKVDGAWLERVGQIVHLLCIIERVVHLDLVQVVWCVGALGWW